MGSIFFITVAVLIGALLTFAVIVPIVYGLPRGDKAKIGCKAAMEGIVDAMAGSDFSPLVFFKSFTPFCDIFLVG